MKFFSLALILCMNLSLFSQEKSDKPYFLVDISTLNNFGIDTLAAIPYGLQEGTKVENFIAKDQEGQVFDLYENLESGPVVVIFYRGHWCGICNRQLKSLEKSLQDLKSTGAQIVAITPESPKGIKGTIEKTKASFPIISDSDNKISGQFDVVFKVTEAYKKRLKSKDFSLESNNNQVEATLPIPATYIIGQDKKVQFRHFDPNYRNRTTIDDLHILLKNM